MKMQSYFFLLILALCSIRLDAMETGFVRTQNNNNSNTNSNNNNAAPNTITIQCSGEQELKYPNNDVTIAILKQSETIRNYLGDIVGATEIYVQIPSTAFKQVFELMKNLYVHSQCPDDYNLTKHKIKELNEIFSENYKSKLAKLNIEQLDILYSYFDYLNVPQLVDACSAELLMQKNIMQLLHEYKNFLGQSSSTLLYSLTENTLNQIKNQLKEILMEKYFFEFGEGIFLEKSPSNNTPLIDISKINCELKKEGLILHHGHFFKLDQDNAIADYFKNDATLEQVFLLHAILIKKEFITLDNEVLYKIFDSFPLRISAIVRIQENVQGQMTRKTKLPQKHTLGNLEIAIARGISNFLKSKLLDR